VQAAQTTPAPSVSITSPAAGATITGNSVNVTVSPQNFQVVAPGGAPVAGQGHLHFYMDVAVPTTPGVPAVTAQGTYHVSQGNSQIWENVTPGQHTFSVQLVNNNHTPFEPPVTASVTVTVQAPQPTATPAPTEPAAPASSSNGGGGGLGTGALVGISIGTAALIGLLSVYVIRRKKA